MASGEARPVQAGGAQRVGFRSILAPLGFSVTLKGEQEHAPELCAHGKKILFFFAVEKLLFHAQYAGICRKGYRRRKKNTLQNPSFSVSLAKAATILQTLPSPLVSFKCGRGKDCVFFGGDGSLL